MKNFITLILITISYSIFSQASVKKAVKSYEDFNYPDVVGRLGEKEVTNIEALRKLASSYKMQGDYQKAETNYEKLFGLTGKTISDLYGYYQVLQMSEKYDEASAQIDLIEEINPNDKRVILLKENKNYLKSLQRESDQFKIKNIELNSADQDFGVTYYKNKVVFTSSKTDLGPVNRAWNGNKLPYLDLYLAKIDNANELYEPANFGQQNKKFHDGTASFNKAGNKMMYTTNNYESKSKDGISKLQLFEAKVDKEGNLAQIIPFPFNNSEYSCGHPALSFDGNILYFASDMPGGKGGVDIYRTTRSSKGKWNKPENMSQINTEGNEMFPFIHESGLFFFSSDGRPGLGGLDIFVTKISERQINTYYDISKITNVGVPINSSKDDFTMVLNAKKDKGFFASNREGGKGDDDIYSFDLLKPFNFGKTIKGIVKDKEGNILAKSTVTLLDSLGQVVSTATTAADGSYAFFDLEANRELKLSATKEKFFEGKNNVSTNSLNEIVTSDFELEKDLGLSLNMLVTDYETKNPLQGVSIKLIDDKNNLVEFLTTESGDFSAPILEKKIGEKINYKIELKKEGYVSKTVNYIKTLTNQGVQNVHQELDLSLGKMEVGKDIGKLININPIYFDLNKSNIRIDAAMELDKIVKAMNEYPEMVIELGSHTDCRSPQAYNLILSDKRAKSSAAYVISKGIAKDRIYGKGYGESKLINGCACEGTVKSNCSEEEHQANRRTEFIIVRLKT